MMRPLLAVVPLFVALAYSAQASTTNVCGDTEVKVGGSITWTSTYSVPIRVEPVPGATWFLGQTYVEIPANGSLTINVPQDATPGTTYLETTFETSAGGNPCGGSSPGMPHMGLNP